MTKKEICSSIILSIKDFLSSPYRLEFFKAPKCFVRKRKLSMLHVILFLLFSGKPSMNTNLANVKRELCGITDFPKQISRQAISKARKGISPALFSALFETTADVFYENIQKRKTWNGLHVFAIDGSKFEISNSKESFEYFGDLYAPTDPDKKFTQAMVSTLYDVLEDYVVDASVNRFLASERDAAVKHLRSLEEHGLCENSVVVFDRGYYSEKMFRYCTSHGILCLMRVKDSLKLAKKAGKKNNDITDILSADKKNGLDEVPLRFISVELSTGEHEYLATNIFDQSFTPEMFRELYFKRWKIESKYMELKDRIDIESFTGATPVAVMQEFYIGLILSNLSALIKSDADDAIENSKNPKSKHSYQANRSFIIGQIKYAFPRIMIGLVAIGILDDILADACKIKSAIQPGRKFKRKGKKNNKRTHFINRKPTF